MAEITTRETTLGRRRRGRKEGGVGRDYTMIWIYYTGDQQVSLHERRLTSAGWGVWTLKRRAVQIWLEHWPPGWNTWPVAQELEGEEGGLAKSCCCRCHREWAVARTRT